MILNHFVITRFNTKARNASFKCNAFTLVELLVAIAIIAILAAIAVPSFSNLVADQRVKTTSADLYSTVVRARSEALKRNSSVTITQKIAGTWQGGWQIADPSNTTLILYEQAAAPRLSITGPGAVTFRSSGRVSAVTTPQFDITSAGTNKHSYICIDISGRPLQAAAPC